MGKEKKTSIGGQALIEGIMMRGPHETVMACRLPDGSISTEPLEFGSAMKKYKILKTPVIRGAVAFIESLVNGYKALMLSAERSGMLDEEPPKKAEQPTEAEVEEPTETEETSEPEETEQQAEPEEAEQKPEQSKDDKKEGILTAVIGVVSMVLGVGLAIVLFMWLPSLAFNLINRLEGVEITAYRAPFEGIVKIIIFVGYMYAVSFMKDIRRVFMYHGAEHKSIFCYEKGLPLTVENVREQKRFHPRCGTSFMILMLIVSIVISYLLTLIPAVRALAQNYSILWVLLKLLLLPLICGLGYELIRFCGRHDNILTKIVSAPGVWLQHISVKEPDDGMIEVAIAALTAVIPENEEDDRW